jgi:hypothetical protein
MQVTGLSQGSIRFTFWVGHWLSVGPPTSIKLSDSQVLLVHRIPFHAWTTLVLSARYY